MKLSKTKTKEDEWDDFIKKYRIPDFDGNTPMTKGEIKMLKAVFWGILFTWIGMMIMIATH